MWCTLETENEKRALSHPPSVDPTFGHISSFKTDLGGDDRNVGSLINGVLFMFLSWFGLVALIRSIVNQPTVGPIVLFVGLSLIGECFRFLPSRHYVAIVFGLFPSICGEVA